MKDTNSVGELVSGMILVLSGNLCSAGAVHFAYAHEPYFTIATLVGSIICVSSGLMVVATGAYRIGRNWNSGGGE